MQMLKGLRVTLSVSRPRSAKRNPRRVLRAHPIQKAGIVDPRLRRVFDNVDEKTTRKDKRGVTREDKTSISSSGEADDWAESGERTNVDWGTTEKTQNRAAEETERETEQFRNEGTSYYKASSISVLNEEDKVPRW